MRRQLLATSAGLAILLVASWPAQAQTSADSAAIAEVFVRSIAPRIKAKVDRGEVVVFNTWKQPWDLEVEATLRGQLGLDEDPDPIPWNAVHFRSGGFRVRSDTAYVEAIFAQCEPGDHMLDWYGTHSLYVFVPRGKSWSYVRWFSGAASDGRCPYEKPDAD